MNSPYGMDLVEDCLDCKLHSEGFFCHLPKSVIEAFQPLKVTFAYPAGATLFLEGQACRGICILCKGRVKLSASSRQGKTLIFKVARPGEILGLNAAISGLSHETTAETAQPCQLTFVKRDAFLRFLTEHGNACMHAIRQVSRECQHAHQQLRWFTTSSAPERVARLIMDWWRDNCGMVKASAINMALTHDEIGQIIGMTRETVTHTFTDFRKQRIATFQGSTLVIQNMSTIQKLAGI